MFDLFRKLSDLDLVMNANDIQPTINQSEFWDLPEIKAHQDIQKNNPYGSEHSKNAFYEMKRICASYMGETFSNDYFGNYED